MPRRPPNKYRKRIFTKKPKSRFPKRNNGYNLDMVRLKTILPSQIIVPFRYVETQPYDPVAGIVAHQQFRANGLRDPNFSIGGHQPYGFDQWMDMYQEFTVIGSKIKATFIAKNQTAIQLAYCGISVIREGDSGNVVVLTTETPLLLERQDRNYSVLGQANTGKGMTTVTDNWSLKKYFGQQDFSSSEFSGTATQSPERQALYDVWITSTVDATDLPETDVVITIDYSAVLTVPKLFVGS